MIFIGDYKRPLSEVQKDRQAGVVPENPGGGGNTVPFNLGEIKTEIKAEFQEEIDYLKEENAKKDTLITNHAKTLNNINADLDEIAGVTNE